MRRNLPALTEQRAAKMTPDEALVAMREYGLIPNTVLTPVSYYVAKAFVNYNPDKAHHG